MITQDPECIFCKIINSELPAEFVYQDDHLVVFPDINPKAELHWLVVPRLHIANLTELKSEHNDLLINIFQLLPDLAKQAKLTTGFRTIINTGRGGGQEVDHIHFHLLGNPNSNVRLPGF